MFPRRHFLYLAVIIHPHVWSIYHDRDVLLPLFPVRLSFPARSRTVPYNPYLPRYRVFFLTIGCSFSSSSRIYRDLNDDDHRNIQDFATAGAISQRFSHGQHRLPHGP